jgi:hypothetical protein
MLKTSLFGAYGDVCKAKNANIESNGASLELSGKGGKSILPEPGYRT